MMMGGAQGVMGGFGFGLGGGLIGLVFNIALLVGLVLLVIWAVQKFSGSANTGPQAISRTGSGAGQVPSAREVLDIRYARGELTREDYQAVLGDLS
jgi:putative membrane protein